MGLNIWNRRMCNRQLEIIVGDYVKRKTLNANDNFAPRMALAA